MRCEASCKNFAMISVEKNLMNKEVGFIYRLLGILERHAVSFEHCPSSIDSMSVIVDATDIEDKIQDVLAEIRETLHPDSLEFVPAIALIEKYTRVVNVDAGIDYRLRTLERAELYHYPLDASAEASLRDSFERLAPQAASYWERMEVNGRYLTCRCRADDVGWFDFAELCDGPRSQNDYIELARMFHAVLLSGVPLFTPQIDDQARRFINLVDEFYDRNVKLVLAAAAPLEGLYGGGGLAFEFQRTVSRLQEMQSHEYLAREHRP